MSRKNENYNQQDLKFTNMLKVVAYLKANGWKIEKSKAYNHQKDGLLRKQKDGLFHLQDVEKYAANHLKLSDGSKTKDILGAITEEKARAERDKVVEQVKHLRMKNELAEGMYVPREMFERELAKRLAVFKSDGENFFRGDVEKTIAIVGGDPAKAPQLIEHQLDALAGWLDRYDSDKEFKVPAATIAAALQEEVSEESE